MTALQATRLCVRALDVVVPLDVHGDALALAVSTAWADSLVDSTSDSVRVAEPLSVAIGSWGRADVVGVDVDEAMHSLTGAVTAAAIQGRTGELIMLNAAALADPASGATVVLVGPSGTGLTTLTASLGTSWAVLGDEIIGLALDGSVVPFCKPLSIAGQGHVKTQASVSALGLLTAQHPCHLAGLWLLDRDPTHDVAPRVSPLGTVDALAALAVEAHNLGVIDAPLQSLANLISRAGGVKQVTYQEAVTLEPLIRRALERIDQ